MTSLPHMKDKLQIKLTHTWCAKKMDITSRSSSCRKQSFTTTWTYQSHCSFLHGHYLLEPSWTANSWMNTISITNIICWSLHEQQTAEWTLFPLQTLFAGAFMNSKQLNEHYFHYKHYLLEPSWTANSWMNTISITNIICWSLHEQQTAEWTLFPLQTLFAGAFMNSKQLNEHYFHYKHYLLEPSWTANSWMNTISITNIICWSLHEQQTAEWTLFPLQTLFAGGFMNNSSWRHTPVSFVKWHHLLQLSWTATAAWTLFPLWT